MKESIMSPCSNGYCEKCNYQYLLDGDEERCWKIKIGMSNVMCVQVVCCYDYKPMDD